MKERGVLFLAAGVFLAVQALGLYAAAQYISYMEAGLAEPVFPNPADVANSIFLIAYILVVTFFIILIIKYKRVLLKVLEGVAVFFASYIIFLLLFPYAVFDIPIAILPAFLLMAWKAAKPSYLSQNVAVVFSIAGAGAVLGVSLEVLPVLVFIALLAIYDFIAVFKTKHMVYMAKEITKEPLAFTAAFPCKTKKFKHTFQLGGGDLAIPLIFTASVLRFYSLPHAVFAAAGAFIALIILFSHVLKKPGRALPALPPLVFGAIAGFVLSVLILGF